MLRTIECLELFLRAHGRVEKGLGALQQPPHDWYELDLVGVEVAGCLPLIMRRMKEKFEFQTMNGGAREKWQLQSSSNFQQNKTSPLHQLHRIFTHRNDAKCVGIEHQRAERVGERGEVHVEVSDTLHRCTGRSSADRVIIHELSYIFLALAAADRAASLRAPLPLQTTTSRRSHLVCISAP